MYRQERLHPALVSRSSAERRSRTKREPGSSATTRVAQYGCRLRSVVSPLGPRKSGLPDLRRLTADLGQARDRCLAALARDTSVRSHGAQSGPLAVIPIHDVKQRSVLRSRGALLRPGFVLVIASIPLEGWAERRQAHYLCCRVCEARLVRASEARRVP